MKLQAIKKCCNDYRRYILLNSPDGSQWISNGAAAWPVEDVKFTTEAIQAVFDIHGKKLEKTNIQEAETTDERFQTVPLDGETRLEDLGEVISGGCIFRVLDSGAGVLVINTDLEKPARRGEDELLYYLRLEEGRKPMVAVYADMFVSGMIQPITGKSAQQLLDRLAKLGSHRARPITEDDLRPDEETGEQMSMEGGGGQ